MSEQRTEYAIEWTKPRDVAGTITVYGMGQVNLEQACKYLRIARRLPGEMDGRVVSRTITWSDWEVSTDART